MKRKYHAVKVGGKLLAYGPYSKCKSYYRRNHWGSKDGVIVTSEDKSLYTDAIAEGAKCLSVTPN